jgi:valyl-tRNA synthetase
MMHIGDSEPKAELSDLTAADKWILSKVNTLAKTVTANLDAYELGIAVQNVYDFIWDEYCDWYIEMVKPRLYNEADPTRQAALWTLKTVLINALKLLHPFMPFVTEEIFTAVQNEEETIVLSSWPKYEESLSFTEDEEAIELIKSAVKSIRNIRAEMNVAPSHKAKVFVVSENAKVRETFETGKVFFATLGYASEVAVQADKNGIGEDAVSVVIHDGVIYMPFAELVDIEKEIERLNKEKKKLISEVERVEKKLANQGFVAKAPQKVIDEEKAKQAKYAAMLKGVEEQLARLSK